MKSVMTVPFESHPVCSLQNEDRPTALAFIGDPHLDELSRAGSRTDDSSSAVAAKKYALAIEKADEESALAIVLGDLFNRSSVPRPVIRLAHTIHSKAKYSPVLKPGNHEISQVYQTENDPCKFLCDLSDRQILLDEPTSPDEQVGVPLRIELRDYDLPIYLFSAVYAHKIPKKLPQTDGINILVTHHNLEFKSIIDGKTMGNESIHFIENCEMVVNGHLHKTAESIASYSVDNPGLFTVFHNPGNIVRLSRDCAAHKPLITVWKPKQGKEIDVNFFLTKPIYLSHNPPNLAFDQTKTKFNQLLGSADIALSHTGTSLLASQLEAAVGGESVLNANAGSAESLIKDRIDQQPAELIPLFSAINASLADDQSATQMAQLPFSVGKDGGGLLSFWAVNTNTDGTRTQYTSDQGIQYDDVTEAREP